MRNEQRTARDFCSVSSNVGHLLARPFHIAWRFFPPRISGVVSGSREIALYDRYVSRGWGGTRSGRERGMFRAQFLGFTPRHIDHTDVRRRAWHWLTAHRIEFHSRHSFLLLRNRIQAITLIMKPSERSLAVNVRRKRGTSDFQVNYLCDDERDAVLSRSAVSLLLARGTLFSSFIPTNKVRRPLKEIISRICKMLKKWHKIRNMFLFRNNFRMSFFRFLH